MKNVALLALVLLLSACSTMTGLWDEDNVDAVSIPRWTGAKDTGYVLEVVTMNDSRTARNMAPDEKQNVQYEYDPERLLSGVKYRLPVLFEKHFDLKPAPHKYYVEMELKELRTLVRTGDLMSGHFGRYHVRMALDYTIRAKDSRVLLKDSVDVTASRIRTSSIGRDPSAELDQQKLYDLVDACVRNLSARILTEFNGEHSDELSRLKDVAYEKKRAAAKAEAAQLKALQTEQKRLGTGATNAITTDDGGMVDGAENGFEE
ncbi:MAG: hypothetical protein WAX89_05015 [Alphaproteobacteria bacterium]